MRIFDDFPFDIQNEYVKEKPSGFTNDFKYYMTYSKKLKTFNIKITDTGKDFKQLPNEILGIDEKTEVNQAFNRFKWVGNNNFIVVNEDGLERHFEVSEAGFNEIAFNSRPLFNDIEGEEWRDWPYYAIRPNL